MKKSLKLWLLIAAMLLSVAAVIRVRDVATFTKDLFEDPEISQGSGGIQYELALVESGTTRIECEGNVTILLRGWDPFTLSVEGEEEVIASANADGSFSINQSIRCGKQIEHHGDWIIIGSFQADSEWKMTQYNIFHTPFLLGIFYGALVFTFFLVVIKILSGK